MRISTTQMQDRGVTAMLERQSDLSFTQQQVASGKRILAPSDDVLGSTQILALNKVIETHQQYGENADAAVGRISQEESALTQGINVLQRVRELAVQAENTTLPATARANLAIETRELLNEVMSVANEKDSNGEYIFSGFNVNTTPFTATEGPPGEFTYAYTGDLGQRNVQIGETRFIAVGDPGQSVFVDIPKTGGGTENVFETLEQFALDLEAGTPNTNIVADLDLALEHLSSFRTQTGGRQNSIDSHRVLNEDIIFQGQKTLSSIEDLDFAEAVSRLNLQLATLQAAQQSFARIQNLSLFNYL
ncbi:MAG: flagellar hook-associated protein FlgL [Gammaproteobacteria bacterium]|nr:flagellar hook-associated protein FlgL [Gammaproteobacteria bacterium]